MGIEMDPSTSLSPDVHPAGIQRLILLVSRPQGASPARPYTKTRRDQPGARFPVIGVGSALICSPVISRVSEPSS